jgi:N6-L-threonylcarbamoyladenine synthase
MLGLGYPGGAILEKMAKEGDPNFYKLPIPMIGREKERRFSYSGLKTAMWRLTESEKRKKCLDKTKIQNLAASFQDRAFKHLIRVAVYTISNYQKRGSHSEPDLIGRRIPSRSFTFDKLRIQDDGMISSLLIGGGVGANVELRKRLRKMARELNINIHFPYSKKLYTDNAAMIGVAAYFKYKRREVIGNNKLDSVDREPRAKIDKPFAFEKRQ